MAVRHRGPDCPGQSPPGCHNHAPAGDCTSSQVGSPRTVRSTDSQLVVRPVAAAIPGTSKLTDAPGSSPARSDLSRSRTGAGFVGLFVDAVRVTIERTDFASGSRDADELRSVPAGIVTSPVFVTRTTTPVPSALGSRSYLTARWLDTRTSTLGMSTTCAAGSGRPPESRISTSSSYRPGSRGAGTEIVIACASVLIRRAATVVERVGC